MIYHYALSPPLYFMCSLVSIGKGENKYKVLSTTIITCHFTAIQSIVECVELLPCPSLRATLLSPHLPLFETASPAVPRAQPEIVFSCGLIFLQL